MALGCGGWFRNVMGGVGMWGMVSECDGWHWDVGVGVPRGGGCQAELDSTGMAASHHATFTCRAPAHIPLPAIHTPAHPPFLPAAPARSGC